ncbi:hypothetical protein [Methylosinus sp. KRF6]|nr:hypothetical protein [Methylosinus sp. KRF6]
MYDDKSEVPDRTAPIEAKEGFIRLSKLEALSAMRHVGGFTK